MNERNVREPDEEEIARRRARFAPGSRYEGLRAGAVGKLIEDAIFDAMLKGVSLNVTLEADHFHIAVTVLDAVPETQPRAEYDD